MGNLQRLRTDMEWARAIALNSRPVTVPTFRTVHPTRETRRLLRLAYRHRMKLRREKQTRDHLRWATERAERISELRALRAHRRRHPLLRVRSRVTSRTEKAPDVTYYVNGKLTTVPTQYYSWGCNQAFTDYHPVLRPDPPRRNPMYAQKYWQNATSCAFTIEGRSGPYAISLRYPKGKWALGCLDFSGTPSSISQPLVFSNDLGQECLQKAIAKIKDSDIAFSEYTVEAVQVMRLLVDPLRTLRSIHRSLERWTRRDNWIWIPQRTARRFNDGVLISQVPLGGVLMSMRTRRTLNLERASDAMISAATNRWLQYRYGVMPLVNDVTTILAGLAERPYGTSWSVRGARLWVSHTKSVYEYTKQWYGVYLKARVRKDVGYYYTAKQFYKLDRLPPLSYALGVHPTQWLRALWNVTPYSFVADWFVNVDRWLLAAVEMPGLKLGPNVVTAKTFASARADVLGATFTGTVPLPAVFTNKPVARNCQELVNRKVDLTPPTGALLSSSWLRCKNLLTAEALILQNIIRTRRHAN